jgi:hypothetical protein
MPKMAKHAKINLSLIIWILFHHLKKFIKSIFFRFVRHFAIMRTKLFHGISFTKCRIVFQ